MDGETATLIKENISASKWDQLSAPAVMPEGPSQENLDFLNDILKVDEENTESTVKGLLIKLNDEYSRLLKEDKENSERGLMVQILEYVLKTLQQWEKSGDPAEVTYTRKFAEIMEILLRGTKITAGDGEKVCDATVNQRPLSSTSTTHTSSTTTATSSNRSGRKIDLIISGAETRQDYSCNEWKVQDSNDDTNLQQQAKNIKVNACLLNQVCTVTSNSQHTINAMDWIGAFGYIYALKIFENVFIVQHVSDLMIPTQKEVLNVFATTVRCLFSWKKQLIEMDRAVARSKIVRRSTDILGVLRTAGPSSTTTAITSNSNNNNSSHTDVMISPKLQSTRSNSRKRPYDSEE